MTGTWQLLRSLVVEARSVNDYKEDIFKYMTQRYGEHASDELREKMRGSSFRDFKEYAAFNYFDSKLDGLINTLAQKAIAVHRAKQAPRPEETPDHKVGPSGRTFTDPTGAAERQARIDAMRQARNAATGGGDATKALMTPSNKVTGHAVGSAGQNQPKQQPSVAAQIRPQMTAQDVKDRGITRSGLVKAQREVDRETREKGVAAGEKLAKQLGVPTTAERTTEHPDTGETRIQIWGPDRVFKHMDTDRNPDAKAATDSDRRAQSHKRALSAQSGSIDQDRIEKIKRGLLQRNAAATKLGPDRPGSFHGERWKPHGREEEVPMSRPDKATGNWIRGKATVNPSKTGQESIWNKYDKEWQLPSVFASREAERGAKMPPPSRGDDGGSQDFGDEPTQGDVPGSDEKTDPDATPFPDD